MPRTWASQLLVDSAALDADSVYQRLKTRADGLSSEEAAARLIAEGPNVIAAERRTPFARIVARAVANPLVILLAALATISFVSGDPRAGSMMAAMIALSVGLRLIQEGRATRAAARLQAMISVSATVVRDRAASEIPVSELVPGDLVQLAAGDMVPADIRIVHARDLFVIQSALTGESLPIEKFAAPDRATDPVHLKCVAFLGTSVASGSASAVVVATGKQTYLSALGTSLSEARPETAFDRGISRFTWLMLRLLLLMAPLVFLINGFTKHDWTQAFFFAVAVAVGLTPEMLPMIVTVCLSKGALAMGRKKVIVKRLDTIQNLGAMDVLCADKTGTLTMGHVILERYCDVALHDDESVLALAYTNSHFQTGLKNVLDRAVLAHVETHAHARIPELAKIDEIPFDFERRIMSVVVRTPEGRDLIISKGAPEAIFPRCDSFELGGTRLSMNHLHIDELRKEYERLSSDGFRVLALATRELPAREAPGGHETSYGKADERGLVLRGYVAFLDPPKETAAAAIAAVEQHGIAVKVLTGDNERVARKVCDAVGLAIGDPLTGDHIERMSDAELADAAERTCLFARVSPAHKQRIISALQSRGHTVGFLGDGINDAPALHTADVGISVDGAVDIAKEAADLILLERSLLVLDEGVLEGRKIFANIMKYVRMGASSNFGNMLSVVGASLFIPFLPMLPIQILTNNLLYDLGQAAIPTDNVDAEQIARPRPWELGKLTHFVLFLGPCSSIFDFTTFAVLLWVFGCWNVATPEIAVHSARLFQSGWFVESLLTQTVIIHVIRTDKLPLFHSRASRALSAITLVIGLVALAIPGSPLGRTLGFVRLPFGYWPILAATIVAYVLLTQLMKMLFLKRRWI